MNKNENNIRIKENSLLAKLGALKLREPNMAMTIGRTIHLYKVNKETFLNNKEWVCHELKHVEQFKRMGILSFLWRYFYYSIKFGYYNNPLEVEARMAEKDDLLIEKYRNYT